MEEYTPRSSAALGHLHEQFRKHLELPDPVSVDFAAAVMVANRLPNDPVWGVVIAAPGSGKTEAVQSVEDLPNVHAVTTLTAQTLLSGRRKKDDNGKALLTGLLDRMSAKGQDVLVLKDFGAILSLYEKDRAQILAMLREVYDGQVTRETGMGHTLRWAGKMGFLAAATKAIDLHYSVIGQLGDRFSYLRLAEPEMLKITAKSLEEDGEFRMRAELKAAMREFVLLVDVSEVPTLTQETKDALVRMAMQAAWLRTSVDRSPYGSKEILQVPAREVPTRLAKQLRQLWRAAVLMGHKDPLGFAGRVARDSTSPPERRSAIEFVAGQRSGITTSTEVRKHLGLPWSTGHRLLEDLEALRLFEIVQEGSKGKPHTYALSREAAELFGGTDPSQETTKRERPRETYKNVVSGDGSGNGHGFAALHEYLSARADERTVSDDLEVPF